MRHSRGIAAIAALATALLAAPAGAAERTKVVVDPADVQGAISPLLFGANHRYGYHGFGMFDPAAGAAYPKFVEQSRAAGLKAIRYPGGTIANTYHFKRAIGPVSERTPNVDATLNNPEPQPSDFGPDEYGRYLEQIGAAGDMVVNFATGDAQEAADWVEYMTTPAGENPGGGVAWADVRARNGHPAPYDVPYWELGNEMYLSGQRYWMGGKTDVDCPQAQYVCLYAFGGTTRFTRQRVGGYADWRNSAAVSDASPGQAFFVKYAPMVPGRQTVYVGDAAWREVDDLASVGAENAYTLDPRSGRIDFGDGEHGNVPPDGAVVTVSYDSGPHDGFVDFYRAMKAANPQIKLCSSVQESFLAVMGSRHPYDCVVKHTYVGDPGGNGGSSDDYHGRLMLNADAQGREIAALQAKVKQYAGDRADDVGVVVTEYGQFRDSGPRGSTLYMQSLDQGLHAANELRNLIDRDVPLADVQALIDFVFAPPPFGDPTATNVRAMFAGPGPDTVAQGLAHVFSVFTHMTGDTHVASGVIANPTRTLADGSELPALETVASTGADGALYLIAINQDPTDDVRATVLPQDYRHTGRAEVWTVDGPSYLSYNTPEDPDVVSLAKSQRTVAAGPFEHTFPAHSVTAIRLTGARADQPVDLALRVPEHAGRGSAFDVTATVTNHGDDDAGGEVELQAPDGWPVEPPTARYEVHPGASQDIEFRVSVPADARLGPHDLDALRYGPGPFLADVESATVDVEPPLPPGYSWLSDRDWLSADNHWGPVERDTSNGTEVAGDGHTITIEGVTYAKGLGVHAPSRITYDLGGACTRFVADVGVDDENGDAGSVAFTVQADGSTVYRSPVLRGRDGAATADVDITGAGTLTLLVDDGGDGTGNDHADWAGARVECGS